MSRTLHIVCLDAPSPPNYGGAIDMYYKVQALAEAGNRIILHYFHYKSGRGAKGLEPFCSSVYRYSRKSVLASLPLTLPHIISSRINQELIQNLQKDDNPILLEGLHCAGLIPHLQPERLVLRMHNNEAGYYRHLATTTGHPIKRLYYNREAALLEGYQQKMEKAITLACLSETDRGTFQQQSFHQTHFIPCFIPWQEVNILEGKGEFCLYHGNMAVAENNAAALWLVNNVFSKLSVPLVIAGSGISKKLFAAAKAHWHITLKNNPTMDEVSAFVKEAHVHVLPSLNRTGVKLKLLNVLLNGRHCLTNAAGVEGAGISAGVVTAEKGDEFAEAVQKLMATPFTATGVDMRRKILERYSNRSNASTLSALW